jgi:hypothetical protein
VRHGLAYDGTYLYSTADSGDAIMRIAPAYGSVQSFFLKQGAVSGAWDVEADQVTVASSLGVLCARIGAARLPWLLAASLKAKLTVAVAALKTGDARAARAALDSAVKQIRSESGGSIPAQRAGDWIKALELLRFHVV